MKFLIAIKNKEDESKNILDIGCKIAEGFLADLTICFVGKKSKAMMGGEVNLARKSLIEWNIYHPGLEVLEWAFNILNKKGFTGEIEFNVENLLENNECIKMILPKTKGYQIRLVLREGDLLSELKNEVQEGSFDIAIVGSPKKKWMTHQLAQFLNTSIFFIKNFDPNLNYKILLCVDDSRATKRAVILSTRVSKQFSSNIINLTVSKTNFFGEGYRDAHKWADQYLNRMNVPYISKFLNGNPVDKFVDEAGENHIIILGKSKGNEILKFIFGSKPIQTAQLANCPVLLVN